MGAATTLLAVDMIVGAPPYMRSSSHTHKHTSAHTHTHAPASMCSLTLLCFMLCPKSPALHALPPHPTRTRTRHVRTRTRTQDTETPLFLAVYQGHLKAITVMVEAGCSLTATEQQVRPLRASLSRRISRT